MLVITSKWGIKYIQLLIMTSNTISKLLFILLGCFSFNIGFAHPYIIKGSVRRGLTNDNLENVTILYNHREDKSFTKSDGSFSIDLANYPDTIQFSKDGYESELYVVQDPDIFVNVVLLRKSIQLNQVQITSDRINSNIMNVDLYKMPVNSAQDLLRKVPGLFIAQHAGGGKAEQIFLRGFDNDHGTDIAISADGIPVNMVSHAHGQGYADLHFLIPETIKDIDFGKGAYYANKGDFNTSGYVSFDTYNRMDNNLFKMEGGSFNTFRTVGILNILNEEKDHKNLYVAGEFNYTDGPFDIKQNFSRANVLAKYNQWIGDNKYISVLASSFSSKWNASGQIPERAVKEGLISRWGSIDSTEGGATSRQNIALKYVQLLDNSSEITTQVFYSNYSFRLFSDFTFYLNDPVNGDEIEQVDHRHLYGFDQTYSRNFDVGDNHLKWVSSVGLRADDIADLQLNHVYQRDSLLNRLSDVSAFETNIHAYTSLEWRYGKWSFNPALRYDYFIFTMHNRLQTMPAAQDASAGRLSPKFTVSYTPNQAIQYYIKTGMGFHSNDVRVVIAQDGKDILPYSIGGDVGVIWKVNDQLIIQPVLWAMYLQQEFVYVGDEAVVEPSGETKRLGVDLSVRYEPFSWLYFDWDINYAYAREIGAPKGENYIPLVPPLTSTGGVSVKFLNGFSGSLRFRYMADKPATEDNSIRAQGYCVNDLSLAYEINKSIIVSSQIQNLFNVEWNEAQFETETRLYNEKAPVSELHFTPGTPFAVKVGVSFKF